MPYRPNVDTRRSKKGFNRDSGFFDYNDTSTSAGVSLTADTWANIPNDGAGTFSQDTYAPPNIEELVDVSTGAIDPTSLAPGEEILIRFDVRVTPSVNNAFFSMRIQLGTGAGIYYLGLVNTTLSDGAREYSFSPEKMVYMGDANTLNNPIVPQIYCSEDASYVNLGMYISLRE